jgi:hypothetical protein
MTTSFKAVPSRAEEDDENSQFSSSYNKAEPVMKKKRNSHPAVDRNDPKQWAFFEAVDAKKVSFLNLFFQQNIDRKKSKHK